MPLPTTVLAAEGRDDVGTLRAAEKRDAPLRSSDIGGPSDRRHCWRAVRRCSLTPLVRPSDCRSWRPLSQSTVPEARTALLEDRPAGRTFDDRRPPRPRSGGWISGTPFLDGRLEPRRPWVRSSRPRLAVLPAINRRGVLPSYNQRAHPCPPPALPVKNVRYSSFVIVMVHAML
jgi:hypothetical protein